NNLIKLIHNCMEKKLRPKSVAQLEKRLDNEFNNLLNNSLIQPVEQLIEIILYGDDNTSGIESNIKVITQGRSMFELYTDFESAIENNDESLFIDSLIVINKVLKESKANKFGT